MLRRNGHLTITGMMAESGFSRPTVTRALKCLQERHWPGNIRELRNVVERLLILGGNPVSEKDVKDFV